MDNTIESVDTVESVATSQEQETKTYTQDEVLKLIQSESDKRVNQALATQQKKYEKQLSLSKLDDVARERAEKDDRIAELEQQLANFQIERNKSELKSTLSARGLSAEFADILFIGEDVETNQQIIEKLDKLFKAAVKNEVEKRLAGAGGTPKGNGSSSSPMSKADFVKLPMSEMQRLLDSNPTYYQNLLKG